MTEPATEAGRRLLDAGNGEDAIMPDDWLGAILAIEQQARAAEHDRLSHLAWAQPVVSAEQARADLARRIVAVFDALGYKPRDPIYRGVLGAIREASDDRRA